MSIFEYDEEKHMKSEREWAYNNGLQDGRTEGLAEGKRLGLTEGKQLGEQRLLKLYQLLSESGRTKDLNRILSDKTYREQLYQENNL